MPQGPDDPVELLEFPCAYEIKAMGVAGAEFETCVKSVISRHLVDDEIRSIRTRESRHGKYVSVTCEIEAISRVQLDAIYLDLNSEPGVLMTL